MATKEQDDAGSGRSDGRTGTRVVARRQATVTIPVINTTVEVSKDLIPYYLAVGAMTAVGLIEWPVAVIIGVGHTIAARSHNEAIRELADGLEAGG